MPKNATAVNFASPPAPSVPWKSIFFKQILCPPIPDVIIIKTSPCFTHEGIKLKPVMRRVDSADMRQATCREFFIKLASLNFAMTFQRDYIIRGKFQRIRLN